jgi:hypothetical protein
MIPHIQTRFGPSVGNCFATCIASIMEVPIEKVDFTANDGWMPILDAILKPYNLVFVDFEGGKICMPPSETLMVLTGKSPRYDCLHSVVGRYDGELKYIHDPHPDGTFITDVQLYGFLCQRNFGVKRD